MALQPCCSQIANRTILLSQVHEMSLDPKGLGSDPVAPEALEYNTQDPAKSDAEGMGYCEAWPGVSAGPRHQGKSSEAIRFTRRGVDSTAASWHTKPRQRCTVSSSNKDPIRRSNSWCSGPRPELRKAPISM
jgi:hypothetical protein